MIGSSTFVQGSVRVSVPATAANLGPGYDALGLALDLRDELQAELLDDGLVVEVAGEGAGDVPDDDRHLVARSMRAGFDALGVGMPGLHLTCRNAVPHARGLGSSSAAIVGGLALARALVEGGAERLDDTTLFNLAASIEGHPDNVAPACFGGLVVAGHDQETWEGGWYAVRADVDPRVAVVALVPPDGVDTRYARVLLPERVPHAEAAANAGRAALLVAALAGRPEHLLRATRDWLHQEYRRPAMPETIALVERLRAEGVPAMVSGAGPTVLALAAASGGSAARHRPVAGLPAAAEVSAHCPSGWSPRALEVDRRGVVVR